MDLPDFDDMLALAEEIRKSMLERAWTDSQIKVASAELYRKSLTDKTLWENGKPPSVASIKAMYEYTGLNGELIPLREKFALVDAELDFLQAKLDIMKAKIDVYRTESANKRAIQ